MNVLGGLDVNLLTDNILGCLRLCLSVPSPFSTPISESKTISDAVIIFRRQMLGFVINPGRQPLCWGAGDRDTGTCSPSARPTSHLQVDLTSVAIFSPMVHRWHHARTVHVERVTSARPVAPSVRSLRWATSPPRKGSPQANRTHRAAPCPRIPPRPAGAWSHLDISGWFLLPCGVQMLQA